MITGAKLKGDCTMLKKAVLKEWLE